MAHPEDSLPVIHIRTSFLFHELLSMGELVVSQPIARPGHKQCKGRDPGTGKASRLFTADLLLMGMQRTRGAVLHRLIQLLPASRFESIVWTC